MVPTAPAPGLRDRAVPAPAGGFRHDPHLLASIRAAHRDRIDRAAERAIARAEPAGMPHDLWEAGCWLVAHGLPDDVPCAGETWFNLPIADVRRYYDALSPAAMRQEIAAGEQAIFAGRNPIYLAVTDWLEAAE